MKDHVALIVKNDVGELLLCKRSKSKKKLPLIWGFPTGTCEENERLFETAHREAFEELGIRIKNLKVLFTKELNEFDDRLHFIVCKVDSGEVSIKEPDEIETLLWMKLKEFLDKYNDDEVGMGLRFLRKNIDLWEKL